MKLLHELFSFFGGNWTLGNDKAFERRFLIIKILMQTWVINIPIWRTCNF